MKKLLSLFKTYLKKSDTLLLALCLAASVYGVILIASATRYTNSNGKIYVQIVAIIIGLILYFLFSLIDVDIIADKWKILYLAGVGLIASLVVFGSSEGGNRAWIRFGGLGIQPAEVVKIVFIIVLAKVIIHFQEERRLNHIFSIIIMCTIFLSFFGLIVVISKDLGSALVYLFIFAVMLFTGGLKLYWFLIAFSSLAAVSPYLWNHFFTDNQKARIIAIFDPEAVDPTGLDITWQVNRSKSALASGRIFGMGLFNGTQTQAGTVPKQHTDFIFTVAGEELGIIGCALVILLLTAIIVRCVYIGVKSQSKLGALVCIGVAAMLTLQMFENIGMCIGVMPVVGLTLPFFSYGGSSIVTLFASMGIVSGVRMKPKPYMFRKY